MLLAGDLDPFLFPLRFPGLFFSHFLEDALVHTLHRYANPSLDADRLVNSVSALICLHLVQYFIVMLKIASSLLDLAFLVGCFFFSSSSRDRLSRSKSLDIPSTYLGLYGFFNSFLSLNTLQKPNSCLLVSGWVLWLALIAYSKENFALILHEGSKEKSISPKTFSLL